MFCFTYHVSVLVHAQGVGVESTVRLHVVIHNNLHMFCFTYHVSVLVHAQGVCVESTVRLEVVLLDIRDVALPDLTPVTKEIEMLKLINTIKENV